MATGRMHSPRKLVQQVKGGRRMGAAIGHFEYPQRGRQDLPSLGEADVTRGVRPEASGRCSRSTARCACAQWLSSAEDPAAPRMPGAIAPPGRHPSSTSSRSTHTMHLHW